MASEVKYLNQTEAKEIDEELFTDYSFSVDQLMELAGLSCATAISSVYPKTDRGVLICCGPGNNGGDGLVCARHLKIFGYEPTVYYPCLPQKQLYKNLVTQCEKMGIPFLPHISRDAKYLDLKYSLVVDALFGFGFRPPLKAEFMELVQLLGEMKAPLVSIDVPTGWDVGAVTTSEDHLKPDCLISLTAPKECAQRFRGRFHFLGGRFIPNSLSQKYSLNLPAYSGSSQCVLLKGPSSDRP